ncbi:MAG: hypothetical protein MJZ61_07685, partial [Bacteroidales bacterium]|nr:hypothetical protein [Bacteroidales bacterium]
MKKITPAIGLAGVVSIVVSSVFSSGAQDPRDNQAFRQNRSLDADTVIIPEKERQRSPIQLPDPQNITTETRYDSHTGAYTTLR